MLKNNVGDVHDVHLVPLAADAVAMHLRELSC